jgi:DNA polymerase I-like protein with 3'-5' exonuclease and polymerase domains
LNNKTMSIFPSASEWLPPESFPDLSEAKEIAIDLETCDPNMENFGPGWPRKDGFIVGYAVAVDGWCGYYPIAHQGGGNLDKKIVESWITEIMLLPCPKIMHNAAYDLGWLWAAGFEVKGKIIDTMIAAGLVDENRFSYALNSLGFDLLKEVKSEEMLKKAALDWGVHPKKQLWMLPANFVGSYGEQDAALTLKLWHHLEILLRQEEVESIFELETEILPILTRMTFKGIRFDREGAKKLIVDLQKKEKKLMAYIRKESGLPVDMWAAVSIAKAFDALGIDYPKTEKGAPSFTKSFLESCEHPIAQAIVEVREINKTHNTFLTPYLDASEATGRIHSHVSQLRGETGGTVTGRLSMNQPNLHQVPARHPVIGPMVRGLFLPEEGQLWAANDFSAQEPRLLIHFSTRLELPGADKMAEAYRTDPDTDFHQIVADVAGITRKEAKTIGLGISYGMGKAKLALALDLQLDEATELIEQFHARVPFLKGIISAVQKQINHPASGGSIRTLLGRKCRFPLYEPIAWGLNKALPYEEAVAKHGVRLRRAYTYKGLNKLLQGSGADMVKQAMVELHRAGFNILLSVHDEIALSVDTREEAEAAAEIMRNCVQLEVPLKVDVEIGTTWGSAE